MSAKRSQQQPSGTPPVLQAPGPEDSGERDLIASIVHADQGDPFGVLGLHNVPAGQPAGLILRTFHPDAARAWVIDAREGHNLGELRKCHPAGFFAGLLPERERFPYRLRFEIDGRLVEEEDPYRFPLLLGTLDLHLIGEGNHLRLYDRLGAHPTEIDGIEGTAFAVWAPNARRVSLVGSFNRWDGRRHPMRRRIECGVWEIFLPGVGVGASYKYEIKAADGTLLPLKADPCAFQAERSPGTASVVRGLPHHDWNDRDWLSVRHGKNERNAPISIYECHLGSWMRSPEEGNRYLTYDELGDRLIPYVADMGFTHLELLPINEYPFDGSWGYQPIGLYAPTSRFGDPEAFARFMDRCHAAGLGVLLDWVPGHFPTDAHGLGLFDGTHLYEHADPRLGFHQDWNTLIYNFGRREVSNFLLANALFWLDRYHADGLRVDAVASMLYLDYSRAADQWIPNRYGGNENLEAIDFLKRMNELLFREHPGATSAAEESTAWPGVSRPVYLGGLGFGYKWNMGWMHDTLNYISQDPLYRRYHHHNITFGLLYAFSENFILPLSHDEVVHGKGSLLGKMPGDRWQKFANLRAYLSFMWTHPGKKLLFMGGEFGQEREWNHDAGLDWHLLDDPAHRGLQSLVRDLNRLYRSEPALHRMDCQPEGFEWIEGNDSDNSVLSFLRRDAPDGSEVVVLCNFTPVVRYDYRVGVPRDGRYLECLNSDSPVYGGSGAGNPDGVAAEPVPWHGRPFSLSLTLPPLAAVVLRSDRFESAR